MKRTPLKRKTGLKRTGGLSPGDSKMKKFSGKRASQENRYRSSLNLKLENWNGCCEGCGLSIPCTPSHLIPRGYDITLLEDPENFHFHCEKCADKCELGEWPSMLDGRVIYEYIERTRPQYLKIKESSYFDRHQITYPQANWI